MRACRFLILKQRLSHVTPEERFDRLWMVARRVASERGITDQDIAAEVAAVRQGKQFEGTPIAPPWEFGEKVQNGER